MSRKEALNKLRDVLLIRREALRKALDGDLSMLQSFSQEGGDVMDAAMETVQDEISSQLVEVESRELSQIEDALTRLRSGHYGECENCNKAIPLARLQAVPYATHCIECAETRKIYAANFNGDGRFVASVQRFPVDSLSAALQFKMRAGNGSRTRQSLVFREALKSGDFSYPKI